MEDVPVRHNQDDEDELQQAQEQQKLPARQKKVQSDPGPRLSQHFPSNPSKRPRGPVPYREQAKSVIATSRAAKIPIPPALPTQCTKKCFSSPKSQKLPDCSRTPGQLTSARPLVYVSMLLSAHPRGQGKQGHFVVGVCEGLGTQQSSFVPTSRRRPISSAVALR